MIKLKEELFAVADGEIYPKVFRAGEVVTGNVAKAALDQGKAVSDNDKNVEEGQPKKRGRPSKIKSLVGAPENK